MRLVFLLLALGILGLTAPPASACSFSETSWLDATPHAGQYGMFYRATVICSEDHWLDVDAQLWDGGSHGACPANFCHDDTGWSSSNQVWAKSVWITGDVPAGDTWQSSMEWPCPPGDVLTTWGAFYVDGHYYQAPHNDGPLC